MASPLLNLFSFATVWLRQTVSTGARQRRGVQFARVDAAAPHRGHIQLSPVTTPSSLRQGRMAVGRQAAPSEPITARLLARDRKRFLKSQSDLKNPPPTACRHSVSGSISLPLSGCFSPFPHGTCSLSVIEEYLGLEGGPPMFRQGFTCPALLEDARSLTRTGLSPTMARLSRRFRFNFPAPLAWSAFARHY